MLQEYFKEKLKKNNVLSIVGIELTTACNMRCIHCYQDDRSECTPPQHLPFDDVKKIIDQLVELKTLRVSLTGGEVFCHPDIIEIIDYIHSKNISIGILSNITKITPQIVKAIKGKVHAIYTTVYGFDEETYEKITRVKRSYLRYVHARKLIKEANIYLEERSVLLNQNSHQLDEMLNQCSNVELKIDVNPNNAYAQKCISDETCKRKYFEKMGENIRVKEFNVREMMERRVCNVCDDSFCITHRGDIIPCINLNYTLGSIYTDNLSDVWASDKVKEIRELSKIKYFSKCRDCADVQYNRYWCLATNSYETGDMHIPSIYACNMCKIIKNFK